MKRLFVIALSVLLVGAFTVPAMAVEHEFGGYWRTRIYNMTDFSGDDSGAIDLQQADTRTRLYYTAILSDEVKLVNQFEMDAKFGDEERGRIGSDGKNFEVKRSFADIKLGDFNLKLGTQSKTMARGFLFSDDFTGAIVRYVGDDMIIPFIWVKAYEGGIGDDANDFDFDYYAVDPVFTMGDLRLNPFAMYMYSKDAQEWGVTNQNEEVKALYVGGSLDYSADMFSVWLTGIYSTGTADSAVGGEDLDIAAGMAAAGGAYDMDSLSIHAQVIYATGDDDPDDDEANDYYVPKGRSYYWAEIMGYGTIDNEVSAGSPGDQVSNMIAFNVGVDIPFDKLSLSIDIWNANLIEDDLEGETELGTEIDVAASYQLLDDLKLQVVAAYLFAGEATGGGDEDPIEVGAVMSLRF